MKTRTESAAAFSAKTQRRNAADPPPNQAGADRGAVRLARLAVAPCTD